MAVLIAIITINIFIFFIGSKIRFSRISNLKKYIASVSDINTSFIWFSSSGKNAFALDDERKLIAIFDKIDQDYQYEVMPYSLVMSTELLLNNQLIARIVRETDTPMHTEQESHNAICTDTIIKPLPFSFFDYKKNMVWIYA